MSIVDSTVVNVLNYSDSYATIATQIKPDGYLFEPSLNDEPFSIPLSFAEIRVVNSQSNIFRDGILRFDSELEADVYERLGIRDWEQILSDSDIRKIILSPTKDGLEKLVKITSAPLFERVRGMLIMLENSGGYDISIRVKDVVSRRHIELYNNQRISDIKIQSTIAEQQKPSDEEIAKIKEDLAAQIREELKEQLRLELLNELKAQAAKDVESDKNTVESSSSDTITNQTQTETSSKRQYNRQQR